MPFRPMSRRKVLAALARHGCEVLRDTGGHTVFVCPCAQHRAPVPRHGTRGAPYVGYQLRPVVVAPDLGALHGPTHGSHQLPRHLDSSARAYFDFAVPGDRKAAYQLVLEAADVADHEHWLQRTQLPKLWAELHLPRAVRGAWQSTHTELARIGAAPHVPQP